MSKEKPISDAPDFNYKAHELAHDGGDGGTKRASYVWMSRSRVEAGTGRKFFADRDGTIDLVYAWATDEAPTSTAKLDLLKNGTSVFGATKPTIDAGQFLGNDVTTFASASFVKGDKFEAKIDSTGGAKGRIGLMIRFTYT